MPSRASAFPLSPRRSGFGGEETADTILHEYRAPGKERVHKSARLVIARARPNATDNTSKTGTGQVSLRVAEDILQ